MTNGRTPNSDSQEIFSWLIIIGALILVWPIGLFLLFRKLSGKGQRNTAAQRRYHQNTQRVQYQQPGTQGISTPPAANPKAVPLRGRGLTIAGGIVSGIFGLAVLSSLADAIGSVAYGGNFSWYLEDLFITGGFCGVGLVLLAVGISRMHKSRRFRRYLPLIGNQTSLSIETLARATSIPVRTVQDDLQEMLDTGLLPTGYLDLGTGRLVLTSEGIHDAPPAPEPPPQPKEEAAPSASDRILSEIRAVNDDIDDPVMSQKIDRIEEITRKIFAYQQQHPDKSGQLRTFLNYYLPTTLKILRAYAQMEEQGVEGTNISAAKDRIEGMMDKVVEGFEKQLDQLFANTAMDITADVSVLERMLEKDGLSQQDSQITLEL